MKQIYIFLISLLMVNCCHTENLKPRLAKHVEYEKNSIFNKTRNSFVYIKISGAMPTTSTILRGQGSGFVYKSNKTTSWVITAAHVCEPQLFGIKFKLEVVSLDYYSYKDITVKKVNKKDDICLLEVKKMSLPYVKFSTHAPVEGDTIYNIAAPRGFFKKNLVPMFSGTYLGTDIRGALYSLYVDGGSSGSMILNSHGEFIDIVVRKHKEVPIANGPSYSKLKKFLTDIKL